MVILIVDIDGVRAVKFEGNSPVAAYPDRPAPATLTFQLMEM